MIELALALEIRYEKNLVANVCLSHKSDIVLLIFEGIVQYTVNYIAG